MHGTQFYFCFHKHLREEHIILLRQQLLLDVITAFMAAMEKEGAQCRAPPVQARVCVGVWVYEFICVCTYVCVTCVYVQRALKICVTWPTLIRNVRNTEYHLHRNMYVCACETNVTNIHA